MSVARYAVIGHPIAHSLSPRIHPRFAEQTGVALTYEALDVAPAALTDELARLHSQGYQGLNATLPHKAALVALCQDLSERSRRAAAVNCLVRTPTGWFGDNTDGEGLVLDLARLGIAVAQRRVLLLGAGGAARGVIGPLLEQQPVELVVSNRNPWKPEEIAERFKGLGPLRPCTHLALKGDQFDLIINATSAGHDDQMPRLPPSVLRAGGACYDLSYGAAHAPFARWARQQGAATIEDGLGMLVFQAAASFAIWQGQRPDAAAVIDELRTL